MNQEICYFNCSVPVNHIATKFCKPHLCMLKTIHRWLWLVRHEVKKWRVFYWLCNALHHLFVNTVYCVLVWGRKSYVCFIFSERELKFMFAICHRPSVCLSSVCLSVTFVRPTQSIEIFGTVCTPFGRLLWPSADIQVKFYGDRVRGTPLSGELNTRGVAEYSDFGPIDGYISETVQNRS